MGSSLPKRLVVYRNCDVERLLVAIPKGHKHLRLIIEFKDQVIVLQEATVAAIVRAYVDTVTHPKRRCVELVMKEFKPSEIKNGYAFCQLIEGSSSEEEILKKWEDIHIEYSSS